MNPANPAPRPPRGVWRNRTVIGAGLTSALGDLCYETATVVLPGYLAALGLPAAALGAIEGAADAAAGLAKTGAGYLGDRFGRRKVLVVAGYALTPVGQGLIAAAAGWPLLLAGRLLSWFGKGLRGPLRDAIVAQAVGGGERGRAFGFHRAMDTAGAVAGPLLGVWLLGWAAVPANDPAAPFRFVLWWSLAPGALAAAAFALLVADPGRTRNAALRFGGAIRALPGRFRRYLLAVGVFGAGDFSHSLLILAATQSLAAERGLAGAARIAGLLYLGRNAVQAGCAYPAGWLADRFGSRGVLRCGYGLGMATATLAAWAVRAPAGARLGAFAGVFALAGLYMAVQETVESTAAADLVEPAVLATGYGVLGAVNGVTKFVSSAVVGWLWTAVSPTFAFGTAAALMAAGTFALPGRREWPDGGGRPASR